MFFVIVTCHMSGICFFPIECAVRKRVTPVTNGGALADHRFAAAYPIDGLQSRCFRLQICKQLIMYQLAKAFRYLFCIEF